MHNLTFLFLFLTVGTASANVVKEQCTHEEMIVAESVQYFIESWGKYYDSYRFFGKCSDGVVSEAFTDTATKLLAYQWEQLNILNSFAKEDAAFLDFVLSHIGGIDNQQQLNQIAESSRHNCPKEMNTLCSKINDVIEEALE